MLKVHVEGGGVVSNWMGKASHCCVLVDLSLNVKSKSSYQDTQAESVISVRRDKCKDVEASEEVFRSSNKGVYG